ncbi:MAG TPA: SMC family ATPase [Edaphocola sp.]|nr:SMC family ATPase [Edaphocola sp.]
MIPKKLILEGLYSYQNRQEIDFESLTAAGLFGIFGATGSGKSSILEAISYVLFGKTERLNTELNYNMMNLNSKQTYIELEFLNFQNKLYKAIRSNKRNSKKFDTINRSNHDFYEWVNDNWLPIERPNVEEIVGMSYNNFKRTIIIPQGQFKEFLELKPTDRSMMMKEIFDLQRFDLQDKTSKLLFETKSQLDILSGQLNEYQSVNETEINQRKEILRGQELILERVNEEFKKIEEQFKQLQFLKKDADALKEEQKVFEGLKDQEEMILNQKKELELFEKIYRTFAVSISEWKQKKLNLDNTQKDLEATEEKVNALLQKQNLIETKLAQLQPSYDQLENKKIQIDDLEKIENIIEKNNEIEKLQERKNKGHQLIKDLEINQTSIEEELLTSEAKIKVQKEGLIDAQVLVDLEKWYILKQNFEKDLKHWEKTIFDNNVEKLHLKNSLSQEDISLDNFEIDFHKGIENLKQTISELEYEKSDLELQKKLSGYSIGLIEGKACPLCGSEHHPHIVHAQDVSIDLEKVIQKIKICKKEEDEWRRKNLFFVEQKGLIDKLRSDNVKLRLEENNAKLNLNRHLESFYWSDFSKENNELFEQKKQENRIQQQEIQDLENYLVTLRKQKDEAINNLKRYKVTLQEVLNKELGLQREIDILIGQLKILSVDNYRKELQETVHSQKQKLISEIQTIESDFKSLTEEITEIGKLLVTENTRKKMQEEGIQELRSATEELNNILILKLQQSGMAYLEKVEEILALKIDTEARKIHIQNFENKFSHSSFQIEKYRQNLDKGNYSPEQYENVLKQRQDVLFRKDAANEQRITLKSELLVLEQKLKEKEKLDLQFSKFKKKTENLELIYNLFKGQGFVNFISGIYLNSLCEIANKRFMQMTNGQLCLKVNEKNEFDVIDFLNEGKVRSAKTLSGGQIFQLSLSLALALAESVQAKSKTEQNFFFIDEGFGTQDGESINTVFETLLNLNKEKKIVGIISHVDELKEQIPMALYITKDKERGSIINSTY